MPAQVHVIHLGVCVCGLVCVCVCVVWAHARKPVNMCVCVCVCPHALLYECGVFVFQCASVSLCFV